MLSNSGVNSELCKKILPLNFFSLLACRLSGKARSELSLAAGWQQRPVLALRNVRLETLLSASKVGGCPAAEITRWLRLVQQPAAFRAGVVERPLVRFRHFRRSVTRSRRSRSVLAL